MSLLTDQLAAFWACNEASGTLLDALGNANLTETSGTIDAAAGGGRDFELADSEWAESANPVVGFVTGSFTVVAAITPESLPASVMDILSIFSVTGASSAFRLGWDGTSRFQLGVRNSTDTATTNRNFTSLGLPVAGTKYWLRAWYDAAAQTLNAQADLGPIDTTTSYTSGVNTATALKIVMGNRDSGTTYYDGIVHQAAIWRRVLTSNEWTFIRNGGAGRTYRQLQVKRSILGLSMPRMK